MAGPWEKYGTTETPSGPWEKYGAAPPAPSAGVGDTVTNFAKNFWGDMTQTGQGIVDMFTHNPLDTVKGIGAAQDAIRLKAQDAMQRGDYTEAARHAINYLIPLVGPSLDRRGDQAQRGDVSGALGGTLSTAAQVFGPSALESAAPIVAEAASNVVPAVRTAAGATKAAIKAGAQDVTVGGAKTATGVVLAKAGPLGEIGDVIAGVPLIKSGLKQMGQGIRAGFSAGREALATPPGEPPTGGMGVLSPDYFDRLRLPPGPTITPEPPAPPDTSFVRSVPGMYPTGPNPLRTLPAPPDVITPEPPPDTSFVRAVPAEYPQVEPGFQRPAPFTAQPPAVTPPVEVPTIPTKVPQSAADFMRSPGQAYAESQGYDWAQLSPEDRAGLESVSQAHANMAAQNLPVTPPPAASQSAAAAEFMRGAPATELESQLADSIRAAQEGKRTAAAQTTEAPAQKPENIFVKNARLAKAVRVADAAQQLKVTSRAAYEMITDEAKRQKFAEDAGETSISSDTMAMVVDKLRRREAYIK